MARQRKKNSTAKKTTVDEEGKADDEDKRFVIPETGIPKALDSIQLFHWMKGMGSAPTILHGQERKELEEPVAVQTQAAPITNIAADPVMDTQPQVAVKTKTNTDLAPSELEMAKAARKLTFSAGVEPMKPTLAAVVQGNRSIQQGLKLNYYPPVVKDGKKIVKLNLVEVEEQNRRWRTSLIGYVIGGSPQFKEMLKFVYGVWHFASTPQVLIHDEGYFIFKFESDDDRDMVLQNGPYTFNNRPMMLKIWEPDFQMSKESTKNVPVWVNFPGLPIQYWTAENLGRIASSIGTPICTDKLAAQEARVSYARMLIEMDVSQTLPETMLIEVAEGKTREQTLSYDWHPSFCHDCLTIRHDTGKFNGQAEKEKQHGPGNRRQLGEEDKRGKK
ncbi:hypothetical protein A4A49_04669 [Nicotiana attenuata]|uniref:DUF4283 domain-containing protein n=1 Tax=Nicotiana attenuata TaxID=49451 RepID=A0A1J6IZD0_NICAT|nr:hypothetical protein A4A49_04669 [Nicotiana attenuata]